MTISNKSQKYGNIYWLHKPPCCGDMTYTSGIRFAFLEEGGFIGIRRLLWGGVVADVGSIFAIAFILPLRQLAIALAIIAAACIPALLTKH